MNKKKTALLIPLGLVIGFINGFFGGGGGMLVVPILIYVCGLSIKKAHATAMLVIFPMTVASSLTYIFSLQADLMISLYVAIGSTAGGILGALLLKKLNNNIVQIIFAGIMLFAGGYMIFA